ncbi:hypothetical protein RI570_20735 [Brucella pseudogrignonensis]|uniref:hypothetical protein n=1 Tax=Brucella pseudogrignonensis TaxID=419475 RepID=UPI0028B7AFE6|nr:hypothetical protein [Brucella pseudogrignonensis]MDT6942482.1 hypothetical protein [Brucella pseudogrignonensis]
MNSLYTFRCRSAEVPNGASTLVIFSGPGEFDPIDLTTAVSDHTRNDLSPELVIVLFPESHTTELQNLDSDLADIFAPIARDVPIGAYVYDRSGNVRFTRAFRADPPSTLDLDPIRRQGLTKLFRDRGGLLEAGPTAHFVKPSGRADRRFLRAAHALAEGAEIFFCAFWLLKLLTDDVQRIHVDTSAIASVAFAAVIMKGRKTVPVITTFKSYDGKDKHPFNKDRKELVLISASQSGKMATDISNVVADPKMVVTLFSTAALGARDMTTLANLEYEPELNPHGIQPHGAHIDPKNSRPINLIGEHFHAVPEGPRALVPKLGDRPEAVRTFLHQLVGQEVFRAYKSSLIANGRRAIWIDVEKLILTDAFKKWVRTLVATSIPASTRAIIHFDDDPSSTMLASTIRDEVVAQGGRLAECRSLTLKEIESGEKDWQVDESPVLVVGGATGHGAEFLMASRALRKYASASHRIYITTAAMPSSPGFSSALKSNLEQPTHRFHKWFDIFVDRERLAESWKKERALLVEDDSLPNELEKRLTALDSSDGLIDNLFLDGPDGKLDLRDNFAFWPPSVDCSKSTQADVFTTIAAIVANIRSGPNTPQSERLINDAYNHCVIAAETFFRFNDGIIQAAFLRASLPIELDYRDAPIESERLAELVGRMVDLQHLPHGEALSEFLLALALQRLKLTPDSEEVLRIKLEATAKDLSEVNQWIIKKIPWRPKVAQVDIGS